MIVAIIGGGASAHLLSVLLAGKGHHVRVMTSHPDKWHRELELETKGGILTGCIDFASSDSVRVLKEADCAFLCMPVHQYPNALQSIVPGLKCNSRCVLGTVYGQGGFDWMIKTICHSNDLDILHYFAIGLLPWIARVKIYGKRVISYGPKLRNGIACSNDKTFDFLQEHILDDLSFNYWGCGKFERVPNFLTLTLTVDNQIIHPSRCFALAQKCSAWDRVMDVPYFYRDFDDYSAEVLKGIDADYTRIRTAYFNRFPHADNPYNLNYLQLEHWSYGSHNPDIRASFVNSSTLGEIRPPVVKGNDGLWRLDVEHRFFKDDFAFGLEIAQWFAKQLDCEVNHIDELVGWYKGEIQPLQSLVLNSADPSSYGIEIDALC